MRRAGLVATFMLAGSVAQAGVAGRVLDRQGAPVAGVAVTAFAPETADERAERLYSGRERPPLGTAKSGPDGAFRVEGHAPVVDLQAFAEGHAPAFARAVPEAPVTLELRPAVVRRGVVTAGGRPVAGARVVWIAGDGSGEWAARTAADGSYSGPDPETWPGQVLVLHPDFAPYDSAHDREPKAATERTLDAGVTVEGTVVDGAGRPVPEATVWVGDNILWPAGRSGAGGAFRIARVPRTWSTVRARTRSLAGSLTRSAGRASIVARPVRTLTGTVRDAATGRPLGGAVVTVTGPQESAVADGAGVYRFEALAAGRYHLSAERPGYAQDPKAEHSVDLYTAAVARLDVPLRRIPTVSGRVRDETGRPVEGALVMLGMKGPHIYAADLHGDFAGSEGHTARTGADGSFTLTLPADEDRMPDLLKERPLAVFKPGFAAGRAELEAGPAGPAPVAVTLTRGIELAGRVRSPAGAPLAGVAVMLAEDGTVFGSTIQSHFVLRLLKGDGWATTDAAGRFAVRVHPAVHHLAFRGAGVAPHIVRGHDPRGGEALEVVLEPAAALRGRVVRPDGRAVPDVTITLSNPEWSMGMDEETATTGADGRFEVKGLARGPYELAAVHAELGIREKRTVEVPAAEWQLVLEASGTLHGRVLDAATRQPVKAFHLAVTWAGEPGRPGGGREADVEDGAGAFELSDVPVRDVSVLARADGYVSQRVEDVPVAAGTGGSDVEIALEADAPIRGRVTSDGKAGVPEAMVSLDTGRDGENPSAATDERGAYELRGVPPGEVTLRFQAQGFLPERKTLDTRQAARLDVTLRRGLSLSGMVVSDGAGVPDATVSASSSAVNTTYTHVRSDAEGRFKIEGLAPGRYKVEGTAQGKGRVKVEDVDPETAGALRLILERERPATLTGRVLGLVAGEDLVYVEVKARTDDGERASGTVDGTGSFRMEDAPAGRVTVIAEATTPVGQRKSRPVEVALAPGGEAEVVLEFASAVVSGLVTRDGRPVPRLTVAFGGAGLAAASGGTDVRGRYEVAGLDNGRYQVSVNGEGASFETEYTVAGSGKLDIDITGGSVQGRTVRADGEAAVAGVEVVLWPVGARENRPAGSATSNARGEFALRSVREGRYRLTTSKEGFGQQVRDLEVERGATASVQVELSPAAGVSVTVVDARDGRALEATVVVRDLGRRMVANSHSADDDGVVNIPLADGSYLLSASASGYGTVTLPVQAPAEGLRVPLTPGGTLVIESARDLRGRARLLQPDGEEYVQCCNGIAEIELKGRRTAVEHVTPGSYTLELLEGDDVIARQGVVLREAQTTVAAID